MLCISCAFEVESLWHAYQYLSFHRQLVFGTETEDNITISSAVDLWASHIDKMLGPDGGDKMLGPDGGGFRSVPYRREEGKRASRGRWASKWVDCVPHWLERKTNSNCDVGEENKVGKI